MENKEKLKELLRKVDDVYQENRFCTPYSGIDTVDYYRVRDLIKELIDEN